MALERLRTGVFTMNFFHGVSAYVLHLAYFFKFCFLGSGSLCVLAVIIHSITVMNIPRHKLFWKNEYVLNTKISYII
jgi:hypothetical protein